MRSERTHTYLKQIVVVLCAAVVCGCANMRMPRIDPTGESLFVYDDAPPVAYPYGSGAYDPYYSAPAYSSSTPSYYDTPAPNFEEVPGRMRWGDNVCTTLSPTRTIAPVGSEVILLAGVVDVEGHLRTNERVEWTLAPNGVGHFVDLDKESWTDLLLLDFTRPKKLSDNYAITSTSRSYLRLTRGTPTANDDVSVLRGQTWVSVTSASEGTSLVTAWAPSVYGWDRRKQAATIHWVDAQWRLPPPAINPAGTSHTFTSTVTRHTDGSPCVGWLVRYEIADGPAAGFAPDGAQMVEVPTDESGQASVEIFQKQPASGSNRVMIQVIRPASLDSAAGKRLVVGSGSTTKTWTSPELKITKTGPAVASVGAAVSYRIQVTNPGDLPTSDVMVTDELPSGLDYVSSNPVATQSGRQLTWRLGTLAARETRVFEVNFRTSGPGSMTSCAEATAAGGLRARDCVTTTVGAATVEVSASGPDRAKVGEQATFEIVITNRGQATATGLKIKNTFDSGLQHASAVSPIDRLLGDLAPGQSLRIAVDFRVTQPGRLCQQIDVTAAGRIVATTRACLTASQATTPSQPVPQPGPTGRAAMSVRKTGPYSQRVGETAKFAVEITNTGTRTLTNVKVTDSYDKSLTPKMATDGHEDIADKQTLVWIIGSLPAGKTETLEVHCLCAEAVLRACGRVTVSCDQGLTEEKEACLSIRQGTSSSPALPSISNLTMKVGDLRDPITVDKEMTYEVRVTNNGRMPDRRVTLVVIVPTEMMAVPLGTSGPAKFDISGQNVRFEPVASIRAGETLLYRIRVRARQSGDVQFRAQLTSQNAQQAMTVAEDTEILAQ